MFNLRKSFGFFFISFIFYFPNKSHGLQKLQVDILFESLCPDSLKFIRDQLYPSWDDIKPYVDINFVPFGKSNSENNGENFVCQHGPEECSRNKIMSCALQRIPDRTAQVQYIACAMTSFRKNDPSGFGQNCATDLGLQWSDIINCYSSEEGKILQLEAEKETLRIKPKFVPTIIYNKIFDQRLQDESLSNFKLVICSLLSGNESPKYCPK